MSKKSFRHAGRIFKLLKKFKNTCRLNAKGAFCPLHTSPAALSQTSSARFFDSLRRPYRPPLRENEKRGVGAAFMAARAAPLRRTHHRRPHPVGADAHIGPLGIDVKSTTVDRTRRRGAHGASVSGSRNHRGPGDTVPGSGRICNPPLQQGRGMVRSADCPGPGGWRADVGIGPYEAEPSNCGANHRLSGGHTGRPSVSKKSFRHAGRIFKLLKKFKNTCRLNAKGGFLPPSHFPRCSVTDIFSEVF